MATIELSGGLVAVVDDADLPLVRVHHWYPAWVHGMLCYAVAEKTPIQEPRVKFKMHQLVLGFPDSPIDHVNGDGLDNRRCNLRLATRSQNKANGQRYICGSSGGYKGVYLKKSALSNRYRALIRVENRLISLGVFPTAERAAMAYDEAAKEYFGEFASLNFPFVVP